MQLKNVPRDKLIAALRRCMDLHIMKVHLRAHMDLRATETFEVSAVADGLFLVNGIKLANGSIKVPGTASIDAEPLFRQLWRMDEDLVTVSVNPARNKLDANGYKFVADAKASPMTWKLKLPAGIFDEEE